MERGSHWRAGCRECDDLTGIPTGSFQGQSGSREATEETITLTRGMEARTRELVVEVMRSDWVLGIKNNVKERVMSRMTQDFGLNKWKKTVEQILGRPEALL